MKLNAAVVTQRNDGRPIFGDDDRATYKTFPSLERVGTGHFRRRLNDRVGTGYLRRRIAAEHHRNNKHSGDCPSGGCSVPPPRPCSSDGPAQGPFGHGGRGLLCNRSPWLYEGSCQDLFRYVGRSLPTNNLSEQDMDQPVVVVSHYPPSSFSVLFTHSPSTDRMR